MSQQDQERDSPILNEDRKTLKYSDQTVPKKKIIKKPVSAFSVKDSKKQKRQSDSNDLLADWKPVKLKNLDFQANSGHKGKVAKDLGTKFLSLLPKARNKEDSVEEPKATSIFEKFKSQKPMYNQLKQTLSQEKWDAEDEFTKKNAFSKSEQYLSEQKIYSEHKKMIEADESEIIVERIHWLNDEKAREVNIAKLIETGWQRQKGSLLQKDQQKNSQEDP